MVLSFPQFEPNLIKLQGSGGRQYDNLNIATNSNFVTGIFYQAKGT